MERAVLDEIRRSIAEVIFPRYGAPKRDWWDRETLPAAGVIGMIQGYQVILDQAAARVSRMPELRVHPRSMVFDALRYYQSSESRIARMVRETYEAPVGERERVFMGMDWGIRDSAGCVDVRIPPGVEAPGTPGERSGEAQGT